MCIFQSRKEPLPSLTVGRTRFSGLFSGYSVDGLQLLVGKTGSGKTNLFQLLGELEEYRRGEQIETFFASFKLEEAYRRDYSSEADFQKSVEEYVCFYNEQRLHQTLDYKSSVRFEELYGQKKAQACEKICVQTASSIDKEANGNTADLDSSNERSCAFSVASRNTAPSFEKQKRILNEMAELVQIFIIFPLVFTVFSRRNDWYHSLFSGFEKDSICLIAPICQKIFCLLCKNARGQR